jgi:hypothetical protein
VNTANENYSISKVQALKYFLSFRPLVDYISLKNVSAKCTNKVFIISGANVIKLFTVASYEFFVIS